MLTPRITEFSGSPGEWDNFVKGQRGWTQFHLHGWRSIISEVHGHECIYLVARDEAEAVCGVLPLIRVRSRVFGHYLISMPFVNYGGPLGRTEAVVALASHATELARRDEVKLLELRSAEPLPISLEASHRKVTVVLDLPAHDPALLWKRLDAKLRSQIRRPQKENVTVRFGVDQVDAFHDVFARHMRDLGTPVQPVRLFRRIAETFPEDVLFGCAYLGGRPIACGCGLQWGDEFELTWASALREYKQLSPNMLLYWRFMEEVIGRGARTFNFGRSTPGSGPHRFKRQWGGRDVALWWYGHSSNGRAATPSPDDARYAWGPKLWRHLPTVVATRLGARIVRLLP